MVRRDPSPLALREKDRAEDVRTPQGESGDERMKTAYSVTGTIVTLSPQPHASVSFGLRKTNFEASLVVS